MEVIYARWLARTTAAALVLLAVTFVAYALGAAEPLVPLERLPALWGLPVRQFVAATGAPVGWEWIGAVRRGDYLNLAAVALLCSVAIVCYARILFCGGPALTRALVLVQLLVLLAAASGALAAAG